MSDQDKLIAAKLCNTAITDIDQVGRRDNGDLWVIFVWGGKRVFTAAEAQQTARELEPGVKLVRAQVTAPTAKADEEIRPEAPTAMVVPSSSISMVAPSSTLKRGAQPSKEGATTIERKRRSDQKPISTDDANSISNSNSNSKRQLS